MKSVNAHKQSTFFGVYELCHLYSEYPIEWVYLHEFFLFQLEIYVWTQIQILCNTIRNRREWNNENVRMISIAVYTRL